MFADDTIVYILGNSKCQIFPLMKGELKKLDWFWAKETIFEIVYWKLKKKLLLEFYIIFVKIRFKYYKIVSAQNIF